MRRSVKIGAAGAFALALGLEIAVVADAQGNPPVQDAVTVKSVAAGGNPIEICSGVKAAVAPQPTQGVLLTEGDQTGDKPITILYKPNDTDALRASETLTCTVGQAKTTIRVEITPKSTVDAGTRNEISGFSNATYTEAFKVLFLLFVLATVLESALALLFNWRPFVETFNARAVKPVVSFAFSLGVVYAFNLDLVTALAKLISPNVPQLDDTGRILTAMVVAGGSSGVNNLMVALGFRQVRTPETATPKPPPDKGWISVSVTRTDAISGAVTVALGVATPAGDIPIVASLVQSSRSRFYRYFFRDPGRFPGSGGYPVKKGDSVTVKVSAQKNGSNGVIDKTWGPHTIADGAIIDLTFTMKEG